jgi:MoxR-like ATPase
MRVQFKTAGGLAHFPGLASPLTLDSSTLSEADGRALDGLVEAAHFFDLPAQVGDRPQGAADMRQYTITITDKGRSHTVQVNESMAPPALQQLLEFLQAQEKAQRRAIRASPPKRSTQ